MTPMAVCAMNVVAAVVVGALAVPLIRRRVPMNHVYGVRFPRSFQSDEVWYRINEYGGRRLLAWSVVVAALGVAALFATSERTLAVLAAAPTLYLVPAFDSWRYSKRL